MHPSADVAPPSIAPSVAPRTPPPLVARLLVGVRLAVVVLLAALVVALVLGARTTEPSGSAPGLSAEPVADVPDRVDALMARHRCSTQGLGPDVIPAQALLRGRDGVVRVTGFDRGWAAWTGEAPGELVAVCLGPAPR
ncbi:hypothetical protein [Nocardioides sp. P86]|uniref:hypothetical protein n=1 Tax=Nocardioides sp. P86 TaxID=2939569 RepID=UPI00204070E9|nr:hypothetical protein [Nocardioides sp. P86]MCM3516780.1 hypothetical protein [Nocardioides sp. P86]